MPTTRNPTSSAFSAQRAVVGFGISPGGMMSNSKAEVASMLEALPPDASLEDIQYHLYVPWSPEAIEDI